MTVRLSVSIAAAPLANLHDLIDLFEMHPVDMLHFDIEDGWFVPSITLGTEINKRSSTTYVFALRNSFNG